MELFTRRELVGTGVGGGALARLLAGAPGASADTLGDPDLARALLAAERLSVFVYADLLRRGVLGAHAARLAQRLLAHEREHARVLTRLLAPARDLPAPLRSVLDADRLLAASRIAGSLSQTTTEAQALLLLIRLEVALERSYYMAMRQLQDLRLIELAAGTLASEAQHSSALIWLAHPRDVELAVPESFVEGNAGDVPPS